MDTYTENVLSLYSGGGGLDIGFRLAVPNARTVCYVERDIASSSVLVKAMQTGLLDDANQEVYQKTQACQRLLQDLGEVKAENEELRLQLNEYQVVGQAS